MSMISVNREKYGKGLSGGLNNGDLVAQALDGLTLDQVYAVAAAYLQGTSEGELREKYSSNNPGQQRMHCGNRLRAAAKKEGFMTHEFVRHTDELRAEAAEAAGAAAAAKIAAKAEAKAAAEVAAEEAPKPKRQRKAKVAEAA